MEARGTQRGVAIEMRMWNRFVDYYNKKSKAARQEFNLIGNAIARHNLGVQTRQVLRARARRDAMDLVNDMAGGEPRKNRRRMALARARRDWRPVAA